MDLVAESHQMAAKGSRARNTIYERYTSTQAIRLASITDANAVSQSLSFKHPFLLCCPRRDQIAFRISCLFGPSCHHSECSESRQRR